MPEFEPSTTAIRFMPPRCAVAAMHTPALLVVPVFRPVVPGYVFKSLFVFTICVSPPRSESIQIWEYSRIFGWRSSSTLMRATSRAEE